MRMRRALLYSTLMHIAIAVLAWIEAPWRGSLSVEEERVIAVEIADISQVTERRLATPKPAPPPAPPKPDPAPREQVAALPPPAPKPVEPEPEVVPIPTPDQPASTEEEAPSLPARPRPKPVPPPEDEFQSVLKTVELLEREETERPKPSSSDTANLLDDLAAVLDSAEETPPPQQARILSNQLTMSEEDALSQHIGRCWNVPVGARNPEELAVVIRLYMNRDGTVRRAEVVDASRMSVDRFFRAAAESAMRAVLNQRCQPLPIPPGKYEQLKVFTFNFDPSKMVGR